jgi:phosphoserine phosphatase
VASVFIATLIAKERLTGGDISTARDALASAGIESSAPRWIEPSVACDLPFTHGAAEALEAIEGLIGGVDIFVQAEAERRRSLLVADMDSTMISVECIDELADYAGRRAQVAEVTERAMQGELVFEEALAERVRLLAGLDEALIARCYEERVRITPGAKALVRTMRREGALTILVSGGFSAFADRVADEIGFNRAVANRLDMEGGKLAGSVARPVLGAAAKRQALEDALEERGVDRSASLAVGDGANDIPMLRAAGIGVAYHAKPAAAAAADARIVHNDLTALLYAQGYRRSEWEEG